MAVSLRDIGFRLGFDLDKQSEAKVENSIKGLKNMATKLLGAIGVGFSLTQINALAEEFNGINDKISYAVKGLADEKETQQAILKAANETKVSYASMADIVSDLAKSNTELFPIDDAVAFSSTVTKLMKVAGRSEQETQSMMEGLNKSFQKGIVDTETLNIMLEQCPEAANILSKQLGVAKTQLLDMASNGQISVQQLKNSFLNASDEIDKDFANLSYSISDAVLNARNSWGFLIDDFNQTFGITQTIAKAITRVSDLAITAAQKIKNRLEWIAEKLGGSEKLIKLVTIAATALMVATVIQNAGKIIGFLGKVTDKLGGINKKTLMIAAVFIILALLVEDFIAFMKGEDSLFGTLLEKAGVDVDKFRENVIKIWNNIKKILPAIWQGIKNVGIPIFEALWKAIKTVFQAIGKVIEAVAPKFADLLDQLANGEVDTASWEKFGEVLGIIVATIVGLIAVVKTVTGVIKILTAIKKAWAVVQGIVNAVMAASPITWIIMAIVALIAIIILLVTHWNQVKAAMQAVWDKIVQLFSNLANWFKTKVIDPIINFFKGLWDGIVSIFKGIWDSVVGAFESIINWVKTNWTSIVAFIINPFAGAFKYLYDNFEGFRDFVDNIVNNIKDFFVGLWSSITSIVGKIKDSIVNGLTTAIDWIKSLPPQALQWGKDIIMGIVDGIKGAVGAVGDAVKGVADKIKGFLGFSEPDEGPLSDFHTYMPDMMDLLTKGIASGKEKVGNFVKNIANKFRSLVDLPEPADFSESDHPKDENFRMYTPDTVELIAKGFTAVKDKVANALSELMGDMSSITKSAAVADVTAAGVTNNSTVSKQVNQNVNISNTFNGDRAGQAKSSDAMNRASDDATSQMARALAFAR